MGFKIGDRVRWMSDAGRDIEAHGIVAVVVPPRKYLRGVASDDVLPKEYGFSRNHESYLVCVEGEKRFRWPVVSKLKLVEI